MSSASYKGASPPAIDSKQLESNQLSSVEDSADHLLETLGYTPELSRNRSTAQVAFMSFVLASIPYGLATTLYYPLLGGGPVDIIWGWVLVSLIIICVAASLGEITSVYPTAGGISRQFQSLFRFFTFGSCDTPCAFVASSPTTANIINTVLIFVAFSRCLLPSLYAGFSQVEAHCKLDHRLALHRRQYHNHPGRQLWQHLVLRFVHQCV